MSKLTIVVHAKDTKELKAAFHEMRDQIDQIKGDDGFKQFKQSDGPSFEYRWESDTPKRLGKSKAYWQYVRIQGKLEYAIHRGEEKLGLQLRNEANTLWLCMETYEQEQISWLPLKLPSNLKSEPSEFHKTGFYTSLARERWKDVISILLNNPDIITAEETAYQLGRAYARLGETELALIHLDEANRLAPNKFANSLNCILDQVGL